MVKEYDYRKRVMIGAVSAVLLLVLWYLLTWRLIDPINFPSPGSVIEIVIREPARLLTYTAHTWLRVLAGFIAGSAYGIFSGITMSRSRLMMAASDPIIEILRPIPPLAVIPFFILWFGLGELGKVLLIAFGCSTILLVTTLDSIRHVSPDFVHAAYTLGANDSQAYRTVVLPAIMPALFAALRVAAALSFTLGIAAEFMGAQSGLGYMIMLARRTLNTPGMVVGILLIGVISLLTDRAIRWARSRILAWAPQAD